MGYSGFFMLSALVTLPVLVAQWVGILGLRHAGRNGAWWTMAAGVACGTLGTVISIAGMFILSMGTAGGHFDLRSVMRMAASALPALGSLLFALGFAVHGLRTSRAASRMQELEQLTAAMSEEIKQLRRGGPAA